MDDKIKEVMGLVCSYGLLCADYDTDECDLALSRMGIESKLGELVPGWLPIESAPKDTEILVTGAKRIGICVAHNDSRDGWETETSSEWVPIYTPTHWMPLPKDPV